MSRWSLPWRSVWLMPLVLVAAALMVLPAGAIVQGPSGSHAGPTALAPRTEAPAALSTSTAQSVSDARTYAPSGAPVATRGDISAATSALARSVNDLEAAGANPASVSMLQAVEAGIQSGAVSPFAARIPSYDILAGTVPAPSQTVSVGVATGPVAMGISDFGLGNKSYELNTSAVRGTTVLSDYNATAGSYYEASSPLAQNNTSPNSAGSPYDSGLQLNTVLVNVTYPHYPAGGGQFWTQNVLLFFGNHMQLLDNVWNFTSAGAYIHKATLTSFKGVLLPRSEGGFYYDYGPKLPVAYPMTVQLYNNATVNATTGNDTLTFGYHITEGSKVYTGTYDTVVFNSPLNSTLKLPPQFRVNGKALALNGAYLDSELVFCGPGAGSNAVITNASGQLALAYLEGTSFVAPDSAYDFGVDTGESAVGLATTWASGKVVDFSQGPSILYGFWGTPNGVPIGSLQFVGHSTPNYAFTFIGEEVGTTYEVLSYAPSNATGVVSTFLPPSIPGVTAYALEAYADEYSPLNTTFTSSTTGLTSFPITLTAKAGVLDAPLYMNGEAQATALVTAVTGGATSPYTFKNLQLNVDIGTGGLAFNLVNDFDYPIFNLVQSMGLTTPIVVSNVTQGPDVGTTTEYCSYLELTCFDAPHASQQFVDYGGTNDQFSNLVLPCWGVLGGCVGGAISLWDTTGVTVNNITATGGSNGVWASTTKDTTVKNSVGGSGINSDSTAFSLFDSTAAVGFNLTGLHDGAAIRGYGTSGATFTYVNATHGEGIIGEWMNTTTVSYVRAGDDAYGLFLNNSTGLTVTHLWANDSSTGLNGTNLTTTAITDASAWNRSYLVELNNGSGATLKSQSVNDSYGDFLDENFTSATVTGLSTVNGRYDIGVWISNATKISVTTLSANYSIGAMLWYAPNSEATFSGVWANSTADGVEVYGSSVVTISNVAARNGSSGVVVGTSGEESYIPSEHVTVTTVTSKAFSTGVVVQDESSYVTITGVTVLDISAGVYLDEASAVTITTVTVTQQSFGVYAEYSTATTINGVTATNKTLTPLFWNYCLFACAAIITYDTTETLISNVNATTYGAALWDEYSYGMQVSSVAASNGQYGLVLNYTEYSLFTGIGTYGDWEGLVIADGYENTVTNSHFVNDASYGVAMIYGGDDNVVYGNSFIGNNGATGAYSPAHIQASSGDYNYFDQCTNYACTTGVGNYWADWHTFNSNGTLAPYVVAGGAVDYFPTGLSAPAGTSFSAYSWVIVGLVLLGVFLAGTAALALGHRKGRPAPPTAWTSPPSQGTGGSGGTGGAGGSGGTGGSPPGS